MADNRKYWFAAIFQRDFFNQMEVYRWIVSHPAEYRQVNILHDRDTCSDDRVRILEDGTEQQFHLGDLKPAHYHMILRVPQRVTAKNLSGRFGNYVNFQECNDVTQYALYLTHETFDSQAKYRYSRESIMGDKSLYYDAVDAPVVPVTDIIQRFLWYQDRYGEGALAAAVDAGDEKLVSSVLSHAYFYKHFLKGG